MNFIIVGCGRVGAELAMRLYSSGHSVMVVDQHEAAFNRINPDFRGRTVAGEALREDVLERAGIRTADGLAAVTNSDTLNAVVSHAARTIYNVPVVVCRNYDPRMRRQLEAFGLQVVSSTAWGAQRTEEILTNVTSRALFSAGNGEVEIYELVIPSGCAGRAWSDLCGSNAEALPVAVTRAGRSILPTPALKFEAGDLLNVSATFNGIKSLRSSLGFEERE